MEFLFHRPALSAVGRQADLWREPKLAAGSGHSGLPDEATGDARDAALRKSAKEFESIFVAEMLRHAGFEKALSNSSGSGGEAFSTLLIDAYAEEMVENGGFGLAERIYRQLKEAPE